MSNTIITDQVNSGKYTLLVLDGSYFGNKFTHVRVDGVTMKAIIAFDIPNVIAVEQKGDFVGKNIEFVLYQTA